MVDDIFISHSSKDKPSVVRKLVVELRSMNFDVWLDEDVILCGDNILSEIEKGIQNSLCVVLVLTPAFFESNWTSLELGLARGQEDHANIIPILYGISKSEIAEKYPFLLAQKYIDIDKLGISGATSELAHTVKRLREKKKYEQPLDYLEAVRRLNNFDTPGTNTVSILITEYAQICKISIQAGLTHAAKIGETIIADVYTREKHSASAGNMNWREKLDRLKDLNTGLNQNVTEHLIALMSISSLSCVSNECDQKILADLSLASILNWYTSYVSLAVWHGKDDHYEVISPGELTYQDFVSMYEIDKLVLRPDLIAPPEITYNWYKYNIYTHIAVRSSKTGNVVGYFALLPVTDELFYKIKSGDFKDNDLTTDGIRQYNMPDFYKLYVACVCVHPDHQNTQAFHRLYHALIKMMYELATEREVYITDIITEASTKQGEKLCKILGLKKSMDTNIDTELYSATLLPPSLRLNSLFGHKLISFYKEIYSEMGELL